MTKNMNIEYVHFILVKALKLKHKIVISAPPFVRVELAEDSSIVCKPKNTLGISTEWVKTFL